MKADFTIKVTVGDCEWEITGKADLRWEWTETWCGWPSKRVPVVEGFTINSVEMLCDGDEDLIPKRIPRMTGGAEHIRPIIERVIRLVEYRHFFQQEPYRSEICRAVEAAIESEVDEARAHLG